MALSLNIVQLAGNLTREVESHNVGENTVAKFTLAINRQYKTETGEKKENTTFIDVECWGRQAELCAQYLDKGRNVLVEGSLKLDTWEKDGQKRSKISVTAKRVHFLNTEQRPA